MDNKVYNTHYNNLLSVAEDGEIEWTTTYKTGHQHTFRTYGSKRQSGHREVKYKGKHYRVHILVAEVYLNNNQPIDTKTYDVHHINGVKDDNRASNLLILTHKRHVALHKKGNQYWKGKHHTEESKRKMSDAHKGKELGGDH